MKYNNEWVLERFLKKDTIKYMFFWGHQPSADGSVTRSCFSQWWVAPFQVDGITYNTAEHWMMAGKARLFEDAGMLEKILLAKTPAQAKKLGRMVKGFLPDVWEAHKFSIVVKGNLHKFSQHQELAVFLVNTNDRVLVEASPVDSIWGIGLAADKEGIENPATWRGQNLLGYALMEVREQLTLDL